MSDLAVNTGPGRRKRDDALQQGAKKKPTLTDPLVHHGRHFGRVIYAFCNISTLITNGLQRMGELEPGNQDESLTAQEYREHRVFAALLKICPDLEKKLLDASEEEVEMMADLIQKGMNGARADDTKTMKAAIVDWITPTGQTLNPPLSRKVKTNRGFHHERTGSLLCPAGVDWSSPQIREKLSSGEMQVRGDQWPLFLYADLAYDPEDPWNGLFRNQILVMGYKHVFTSPSSVDEDEPKATRSGNARIHGMTCVTKASLAYIATQVHFALCSSSTFSCTDTVTDSETFYNSVLDLLEDIDEKEEVQEILTWWNRKIFPHACNEIRTPIEGSALSRIKEKRQKYLENQPAARGAEVEWVI